jgi:hypothetical protein
MPHCPPMHVAVPFCGTGQTVHDAPQVVGLSETHWPPQLW